jgi:hypothetical protein
MTAWWKEIINNKTLKKIAVPVNGLLLLVILAHSILRDITLEKQFSTDLRNRVVGARLQKDGRLPYFYHWQEQDGIRYFDPNNSNHSDSGVSNITSSPLFHQLMYPICDLQQKTISWIWLAFQYLLLTAMIAVACSITENRNIQWMMLNAGILFTLTEAWKCLILTGQNYFFFAFLVMCIISGILSNKKSGALIAGILLTLWILNRPIGLIVLLPLLLLYKHRKFFFFTTFVSVALYAIFVMSSSFERALWKNYLQGMRGQVHAHQVFEKTEKKRLPSSKITSIEGIDLEQADRNSLNNPVKVYSENGNFFVIYRELFHKKISQGSLYIISMIILGGMMIFFYVFYKKRKLQPVQVLLFAFTLYMVVEIMSPIYRHQYYSVEWLPLLLTALLITGDWRQHRFWLLVPGLLLQMVNFHWLTMRHTLGEIAWIAALLFLSVTIVPREEIKKPLRL